MDTEEREYEYLILAAWLHDVGKFYQRAGFSLDTEDDKFFLSYYGRKKGEGKDVRYTHRHAIFSAKFIREMLGKDFDQVAVLVALHHSPEEAPRARTKYLAKLITLADWMSSGERRERESEEDSAGYQAEPLLSIFTRLKLKENGEPKEGLPAYLPLTYLKEDLAGLFALEDKKKAFWQQDGKSSYKNLWDEFIREINLADRKNLLMEIPYFLNKFTLSIPASTVDKPDISLFHHAQSTVAIAACLYLLQVEERELDLIFDEIKKLPLVPYKELEFSEAILKEMTLIKREDFILLGGDISGIQDFIYSITSGKALKGLRGRSFYLQLISEAIAKTILDKFNLPEANLLYSGGGNFFILLPKLDDAENRLNSLKEEIDSSLLKAHRGKIAVILSWVPLTYSDFFIDFARLWTKVAAQQAIEKKKKFASLLGSEKATAYLRDIIGPFDIGGENPACSICGDEIEKTEGELEEKEEEKICSLCQSFADLSEKLSQAEAIGLKKIEAHIWPDSLSKLEYSHVLAALGFDCQFLRKRKTENAEKGKKYFPGYLRINSTDFAGLFSGFKFIANKVVGPNGNTLTLEEMAREAEGIKKWGVIRADIDRLGEIFMEGLGADKTISRLAMLSTSLSIYFGAICQRMNYLAALKKSSMDADKSLFNNSLDYIYVVYSGGDDLFLLGPWSVLPELSQMIYQDFQKFTSYRLTLSASIFIAPSEKFPIYQAANEAGLAEKIAKEQGRNRIYFLKKAVSWAELDEIKKIAYKLRDMLSESRNLSESNDKKTSPKLPRALLSLLYYAYREKELKEKKEIPMERIWRLHYAFKRMMERVKRDESKLKALHWLLNKSLRGYEIYPELNIAARWAEYLTRKEGQR